jgi:orotidine-5'-phosphate decarboxylase
MMRRTVAEVADFCDASNRAKPFIIGVTVLTSTGNSMMEELGIASDVNGLVSRLALLAETSGLDGVVASASEIEIIRSGVSTPGFLIVTPGIRPNNATNDDQKRVMLRDRPFRPARTTSWSGVQCLRRRTDSPLQKIF